MRLSKILLICIAVMVIATGKVHQRVETVKAGYELQESHKYLSYLIDRNSRLMYDLSKVQSPRYLLASLSGEDIVFASRRAGLMNSYRSVHAGYDADEKDEGIVSRIFDLFTVSAEARSYE